MKLSDFMTEAGKIAALESLEVLSDRKLQYDLWVNIETPGMSSITENGEALFSGNAFGSLEDKDMLNVFFSDKFCDYLKRLDASITRVETKSLYRKRDHPKVIEMRDLATIVLYMFKDELRNCSGRDV